MHINRLSGLPTLEHATYNGPWENNPYSDLYLMILMIALELCWWWLLIDHSLSRSSFISPCAPRRPRCSCVPVSRSSFIFFTYVLVIMAYVWSFIFPVSRSSFVSRCPGLYIHSFFSFVFLLYFFPFLFFFFFSLFRFLDFLVFLLVFSFFFFLVFL